MRCAHSSSTGGMARNNGPGKLPREPMLDWLIASSAALAASVSVREGAQKGSTGRKSTEPATLVFRLSVAKRVILWMPDSPAVRRAQLSALPSPREVTTPKPVTTTIGRPALSVFADIMRSPSAHRFDQRQAFTPPMPHARDHHLRNGSIHGRFHTRFVSGREQLTTADNRRGQRDIHRKLRLQGMPKISASGTNGSLDLAGQEGAFLAGGRLSAACPGQHREMAGAQPLRHMIPQALER